MVQYKEDGKTLFDSRGREAGPLQNPLYSELLGLMEGQQKLVRENQELTDSYNRTLEKAQYNADLGNLTGVPIPIPPDGHEMDDYGKVTVIDLELEKLQLHGCQMPEDPVFVKIEPTPPTA